MRKHAVEKEEPAAKRGKLHFFSSLKELLDYPGFVKVVLDPEFERDDCMTTGRFRALISLWLQGEGVDIDMDKFALVYGTVPCLARPDMMWEGKQWTRVVDLLSVVQVDLMEIATELQKIFDNQISREMCSVYPHMCVEDVARFANLADPRASSPNVWKFICDDYRRLKFPIKQLDAMLRSKEVIIADALTQVATLPLSNQCQEMLTFLAYFNPSNYFHDFVEQFVRHLKTTRALWIPEWRGRNVFEKHMFGVFNSCETLSPVERELVVIFMDSNYPSYCNLTYGETQTKLRMALGVVYENTATHTVVLKNDDTITDVNISVTDCGMRNYEKLGIYDCQLQDGSGQILKCTHAPWTGVTQLFTVPLY